MLSTPPAFVLSQNQTLKFNILKAVLIAKHNCSNDFRYCWLFFWYIIYSKLIDRNISKHKCFVTISFYSIFKQHWAEHPFNVLPQSTAYTSYHIENLMSTVFCNFFQIFLIFFEKVFQRIFPARQPASVSTDCRSTLATWCAFIKLHFKKNVKRFFKLF